jgi:hypothetical protein
MRRPGTWVAIGLLLAGIPAWPTVVAGEADEAAWHRIDTPQYALLSQRTERDTRAWAADFDLFIDSLGGLLGTRQAPRPPLTVVLLPPEPGAASEPAARRRLLRDGVRWMTDAPDVVEPAWFETGLAELFCTFDVRREHVRWGEPMPEHVALLRERGLIPLRDFLDDPQGARALDARRFTAQAWALTHLLLVGGPAERRQQLAAWLRQRPASATDASAFRATFLADPDRLQQELETYLRQPQLDVRIAPRSMVERKYRVTPASAPAVASALDRLELPAGAPVLAATGP